MKNIDFLPDRYQERDLKRKATLWQYALLLGFGSVLLAATLGQFVMKRSLQASLAELKQGRIETNLKRERVQLLKQQLGNTEPVAALFTYLQHPWPRTQLIARITDALPIRVIRLRHVTDPGWHRLRMCRRWSDRSRVGRPWPGPT